MKVQSFNYKKVITLLLKTAVLLFIGIHSYAQKNINFDLINDKQRYFIKDWTKEFKFLKEELKDKDIILLGEGVHTSVEVNNLYAKLIQYLYDSLGYDVLLTERGFYDLRCLDRYRSLKSEKELIDSLNEELPHSAWYMYEKEILKYWFEKKSNNAPLNYYGIDIVYPLSEVNKNIFKDFESVFSVSNRNILIDSDYIYIKEMFLNRIPNSENYLNNESLLIASLKQISTKINVTDLDQTQKQYWSNVFDNLSIGLYYNLDYLKTHKKSYEIANGAYWNKRDSMMAQNVNLFIDKYEGHKFIVLTSTYHITSNINQIEGANKLLKNAFPMGEHIRSKYKERTFFVTTLVGSGTVGTQGGQEKAKLFPYLIPRRKSQSLEAHLNLNSNEYQYLSLKSFPEGCSFIMYPYYYEGLVGNWKDVFDGVFFIKKVTSKYPSPFRD